MKPIQPHILWVSGALYTDIKQLGCEADHTLPSSSVVKNEYSRMSTSPDAFMECTGTTLLHRYNVSVWPVLHAYL